MLTPNSNIRGYTPVILKGNTCGEWSPGQGNGLNERIEGEWSADFPDGNVVLSSGSDDNTKRAISYWCNSWWLVKRFSDFIPIVVGMHHNSLDSSSLFLTIINSQVMFSSNDGVGTRSELGAVSRSENPVWADDRSTTPMTREGLNLNDEWKLASACFDSTDNECRGIPLY
jgi:hypothetical protein